MPNPHAWLLSDLKKLKKPVGIVMSTFACGGGSTMGYKRAGFEVVAANDIDPVMANHYKKNHRPKHYFLGPISNLLTEELPPELYNLDILDGSPPCSSFSQAGSREKGWGKLKKFREGQSTQVLDTLFFDYLDLVGRLQPKISIAENVQGLVAGNARRYVSKIIRRYEELGYHVQLFLLNAADCGVPQYRSRVFFCAIKKDLYQTNLLLRPNLPHVSAFEATSDLILTEEEKQYTVLSEISKKYWVNTLPGENFARGSRRLGGKDTFFNHRRLAKHLPCFTLCGTCPPYHWSDCRRVTLRETLRFGSFPDDYWTETTNLGRYIVGMSVPPKMTEYVAREIYRQWLKPLTEG